MDNENTTTPFEMRLSEVPAMPQPQLDLTYATAIPSNGGTFTANQEVRIPLNVPSECFVDMKRAYIKYNIKNTSAASLFLDPLVGGATVIDNWRVVGGTGALLEEVIHYNAYYAVLKSNDNAGVRDTLGNLMEGASTDSGQASFSSVGETTAVLQATGATELAAGASRGITHRPASAFFNADRYMPLGYTQGTTYISITLCANETAMISGSAAPTQGFETSNWELHLPILRPGPDFSAMFRSAMGSGVPIQIHSVGAQNTQQSIPVGAGGQQTLTFSTRKRSVKSIVTAIRRNNAITSSIAASISGFINCQINEYNYSVGGIRIPAQQIKASVTDPGQLVTSTQLALGYFSSDLRGVNALEKTNTAKPESTYYQTSAKELIGHTSRCQFAIDLESYEAAYAGKNLAGQGLPLVLHCTTGTGDNTQSASLCDCYVIHDTMFILDGASGVITANS
jgi:hypothetical protein